MKRSILCQIGSADRSDFDVLLEEVRLAEELEVDTIWCFPASGAAGDFSESAPSIWLSALASRTERIRLGWGLAEMTPPKRPPLRIAEQAAAIDLASKGRLELALLPDGNLESDDDGHWDEGMRMLVEMWDQPSFSWSSSRFNVMPVDVLPKPIQHPHPPLWLAGWTVEQATQAGQGGLAFFDISGGTDDALILHRDAYTEARAGANPDDLVSTGLVGVAVELESTSAGIDRLTRLEDLGFDHVTIQIGGLDGVPGGGHEEAKKRIRFLANEDARVP